VRDMETDKPGGAGNQDLPIRHAFTCAERAHFSPRHEG
jgi:hypothetical protein